MISRFNKVLLEKYPLFYHSKAPYLLVAGLMLWLLSYVIGYIALDSGDILEVSVDKFYYSSLFVALHILICIMIVSVWAIHFYRLNPLKHIYPLQKYYYTKLLLLLAIPFWFMISAKTAFDVGAHAKFQQLVSEKEMVEDAKKLNLGYPFLLNDLRHYRLSERSYPNPFPVTYFFRVNGRETWSNSKNVNDVEDYSIIDDDNSNNRLFYNENYNKDKYVSVEFLNDNRLLEFLNDSVNHTLVESTPYVFYSSQKKYLESDSCHSYRVFSHLEDVSQIRLKHSSIYNFSTRGFGKSKLPNDMLDDLHKVLDRGNKGEIKQILNHFINVLDKYKITYTHLEVDKLADYHIEKGFEDYDIEFVNQYSFNNPNYGTSDDYSVIRDYTPLEEELTKAKMRIDFNGIQTLSRNYSWAYYNDDRIDYNYWLFYGCIALLMAMFFIWFEFMEIKSLLISIPIAGVLGIIFVLGIELMNDYRFTLNQSRHNAEMVYAVIYCLLIIGITYVFVKRESTNRRIASIGMNLTYYLSSFIFLLMLGTINELMKYSYEGVCNRTISVYPIMEYLGELEYYVLPLSFIGVTLFYRLVKPWKAKKKSS